MRLTEAEAADKWASMNEYPPAACSACTWGSEAESSDSPLAGLECPSDVGRLDRLSHQLKSFGSKLCRSSLLFWRCKPSSGALSEGESYVVSSPSDNMDGEGSGVIQA